MASRAQKLVSRSVQLEFTQLDDHRTLHNDTNGVGPRASGKQKKIDWIPIWRESEKNIELGFWGTFYKSVGWLLNAATFHAMCELIKNKSIEILSPCKLLWNPCNASVHATGFHTIRYSTFCCYIFCEAMQVCERWIYCEKIDQRNEKKVKSFHMGFGGFFFGAF